MAQDNTAFFERSKQTALGFLQTVVVVDDRAEFGPAVVENEKPTAGLKEPGPGVSPSSLPSSREAKAFDPESLSHKLDAKELIDVFAEHGLVCAVLKPTPEEIADTATLQTKTKKVARRSDIIVLDWQLDKDGGDHALGIIKDIVEADKDDKRLRLIVIYTGETGLTDKIESVKTKLADPDLKNPIGTDGEFILTDGRIRVVAYAKEDTRLREDQKHRIRRIEDLPDTLIADFTEMTSGLVSNTAVASLAAVRRNTHRLLLKMRFDLDAPYMAHRSMLPSPDDAPEHVVGLIGAELQSIIEQSGVAEELSMDNMKLWLLANQEKLNLANLMQAPKNGLNIEAIYSLLEKGCDGENPHGQLVAFGDKPYKKIHAGIFCETEEDGKKLDDELAVLFSTLTQYRNPIPHLTLGHIISDGMGEEKKFWVCLQPRCDSIRIAADSRAFPMLPLKVVDANSKFDIVVEDQKSHFLHLKSGKNYDCVMVPFDRDRNTKCVVASHDGTGFYFVSRSGTRYNCIAQLKQDHAQSLVSRYSAELSRIPLNPAEWLRRMNK